MKRVIFDILLTKAKSNIDYEIVEEMENCDVPELTVQNDTFVIGRNDAFGYLIEIYLKDNTRRQIRFDHTVNVRDKGEIFIITPRKLKTYAPYRPRTTTTTVSTNTSHDNTTSEL